MKRIILSLIILVIFFCCMEDISAQIPPEINYQGYLVDNGVPVNVTRILKFEIWDVENDGDITVNRLWYSIDESITIQNGLYTYKLGQFGHDGDDGVNPPSVPFNQLDWNGPRYLQVVVEGVDIIPRTKIISIPYALISSSVVDNAVTSDKLNANLKTGSGFGVVPSGCIMMWPTEIVPNGWLVCNGQELDKSDPANANLLAAIGTRYGETDGGGNPGTSHFKLPNFHGYFVRGWTPVNPLDPSNPDTSVDPDRNSRSDRGDNITYGNNVGTKQADGFTIHTHYLHDYKGVVEGLSGAGGVIGQDSLERQNLTAFKVSMSGGNETRPKNINMMYIIKK